MARIQLPSSAVSMSPPIQEIVMSPKLVELVELDEALLVQLEDREEAHDDLEPVDQRPRELAERDAARRGAARRCSSSTASVTLARIGATWSRSTRGRRLGRDGAEERGAHVVGGDAGEQVGREVEEAIFEAGGAGIRTAGRRSTAAAAPSPRL